MEYITLRASYFTRGEIGSAYAEEERTITGAEELKRMITVALKYVEKKQAGCHFSRGKECISIVYESMAEIESGVYTVYYRPMPNVCDTFKMSKAAVKRYIYRHFTEGAQSAA